MKCNNCGTEFEGTVCPECGANPQTESSEEKISGNEFSESPKKSENEFSKSPKQSGKPQSAFAKSLKANKKIFIIVAVFLILLIVLGSSLTAVLTDDFRIGNMEKITIGMPKDYVRINLGEPHETEENETLWKYYSPNYKKFLERSKDDADFSEKKAAFVHNEIRITFSDDKVYAVEMLKDFSENTKDAKKEIKNVQLSRNSIRRYTYFENEFYAAIQYKDGSFKNAPVPLKRQPNTVNLGINHVSWYDEWSRSEITQEITVVPNPDIYLRGRLPGTEVRYLAYEIEGGYALEIFGSGTIATEATEYPWHEIKHKLLYLKVSEGITQIENNAFNNYDALLSAELPESMTSIGANAFYNCNNLKNINIPDSVTSIGSKAFGNCSNLKNINFPDSLTYVGADAFLYTPWYFNQPHGLVYVGNILYEFKGRMPADTKITIKEGTVSIADRAFYNYNGLEEIGLTEIEIPSSVTSIGSDAFSWCRSLTKVDISDIAAWCGIKFGDSDANPLEFAKHLYINGEEVTEVVIPEGVTSIGDYAFRNCSSLESIVIPEGVTSIGDDAFYYCSSLESIVIPSSVKSIGSYTFIRCDSLTKVEISDIEAWCGIEFDGSSANPLYYAEHLYLNGEEVTKLVIPEGVTSIGDALFYNCSNFVSVEIPNSVTSIGRNAFRNCSSLESITIPYVGATKDGTSSTHFGYIFGAGGYYNNSINVPKTLKTVIITGGTSIGSYAFYECSSLVSVIIPEGVKSIGDKAFAICSSLVSIEIPSSVTSIGDNAFASCSGLVSVLIPNSVTSIDSHAFGNCLSLTIYAEASAKPSGWNSSWKESDCPVVWDYKNNDVADDGFIYMVQNGIRYGIKDGAATVVRQPMNITTANIPSEIAYKDNAYRVTSIGDSAFYECSSLESVLIPTSVTSIGDSAFGRCSSLKSIEIPNSVTSIVNYAFASCSGLVSVEIPSSVTSIGSHAFYYCSSLKSLVIPDSVTSIGFSGFSNCSSLETITVAEGNTKYHSTGNCLIETETKTLILGCKNSIIPTDGSVTSIGSYAFYGCSDLKSIVIPDSVTSIGYEAFRYCSSLVSVIIPSSVTSIGYEAFHYCSSLESIEYGGTKEEWIEITKGDDWNYNTGNYTVTCSNGTLTKIESQA